MTPSEFVRAHTVLATAPLVPEVRLQLATEITPIWQAAESWLAQTGIAPPFWAFAWPGAQALARLVLDEPDRVRDQRVLDFAAGGGLAAIACALAGAQAEAAEIDPLAIAAIDANAALNGVTVQLLSEDVVGLPARWDIVLCGDVCYEAAMTRRILPWLRRLSQQAEVWIADPGRAYLPRDGMEPLAVYEVATTLELEDRTMRTTTIYRLRPN